MIRLSSDTRFQLQPNQLTAVGRPCAPKVVNRQATQVTFCVRGVSSPLLANLFLHYAFDKWMARNYPHIPFERYADDAICHCKSAEEAQALWGALADRLAVSKLVLHPEKTKIVYCKDANRRGDFSNTSFDFLGFAFRARKTMWGKGKTESSRTASSPPLARTR